MEEIYLAVSDKLGADVPEIKWIDFDLGQLEQPTPPVSYPCILLSITEADYEDLSGGGQQATVSIVLRIAFKTFERTHNNTNPVFKAKGLEHFKTIKKTNTALSGLSGDNFSKLRRTSYFQEPRSDIRVYNITYTTLLKETTESPYQVNSQNQPNLEISEELKKLN